MHSKIIIGVAVFAVVAVAGIWFMSARHTGNTADSSSRDQPALGYLPLGDSYTIGESAAEAERWPNQLVGRFAQSGHVLRIMDNPAVTGYTSQNLIDRELPLVGRLQPDFVSVQIGVNDYVQGVSEQTFGGNLEFIITSLKGSLRNPRNIILVTIPDFGKTPAGARYAQPAEAEHGIRQLNDIIKAAGTRHDIAVADIFPVSQRVSQDSRLTAADSLHPSGAQYTLWTDIIYDELQRQGLPEQAD